MGIVDYISREWKVISRAPVTFIVGGCLIGTTSWIGATEFYREELATSRQQRDYWKDRAQTASTILQPAPSAAKLAPVAVKPIHHLRIVLHKSKIAPTSKLATAEPIPPQVPSEDHFWDDVAFVRGSRINGSSGQTFKYSTRGGTFIGNSVAGYDSADVNSEKGIVANNVFTGPNTTPLQQLKDEPKPPRP